jgi:cytochrome P450
VLRWYDAIVGAVTEITAGGALPDSGRAGFTSLAAAIEEVLDRGETASLLGAAASDAGGLARDEVVSNAAVLLFGGIETTEGMIANAVLHLLEHPDQRALVDADRTLLAGAVEESLRLEPAAAVVDRYATRDTELGGARIAAGDLVVVSIAAANRDPAVVPGPRPVRRPPGQRAPAPRVRRRAPRVHRDAPRPAGGPHGARPGPRPPAGPAPGPGGDRRRPRLRVPQAAKSPSALAHTWVGH